MLQKLAFSKSTIFYDLNLVPTNLLQAKAVLKTYARGISTLTDYQTMVKDLENLGEGIDIKTLSSYIDAFEKLFIIENVEAWTPKLRSAGKIRTKAKKQFSDPSIAAVALGAKIIEKHVILDKLTPGPDQSVSIDFSGSIILYSPQNSGSAKFDTLSIIIFSFLFSFK